MLALEIQLQRAKTLAATHLLDCAIMEWPRIGTPGVLPVPHQAFNDVDEDGEAYRLLECWADICRWDIDSELQRLDRDELARYVWFAGTQRSACSAFHDFAQELGRLIWEQPSFADEHMYGEPRDIYLRWVYELHRQACEGLLAPYGTTRRLWVANMDLHDEFFRPEPSEKNLLWWNYNRYGDTGRYSYSHKNTRVTPILSLYVIPHDKESAVYHAWDYAKNGKETFWRKLPLESRWLPGPEPHPCSISDEQASEILRRHSYIEILDVFAASCQALQSIINSIAPVVTEARLSPDYGNNVQPSPKYRLRRRGGAWDVSFQGAKAIMVHSKGLEYIARLLAEPNPTQALSALSLLGAREELAHVTRTAQMVVDKKAQQQYLKRLGTIQDEEKAAQVVGDQKALQVLADEKKKLIAEAKAVAGYRGKGKELGPRGPARKAADNVRKAIERTRTKLAESGLQAMADHLKAHLRLEGNAFAYRPDPVASWEL